ncbi:ATP-binding protein [Streptomyces sp. 150FB]|uniref:sensor histidine kinase n=1 Tax=Streptomyces sp. 150FB TaxID=1576605 RepID=UPI0007C6AE06|nr:ATP-binding protein [Streptomyces sp. 150FB]
MRLSLRPTAPALLISAAVSGLLCGWAVSSAPSSVRTPLAWGSGAGAVLLTAAVTLAASALWSNRQLRRQNDLLTERAGKLSAEVLRAAENVRTATTEAQRAHEAAARSDIVRASAAAANANAAGRMQALMTGMLADLRDMEDRHADEEVLGDLLHLDHRTAQAGRLADSFAVLTGARSGRRWARPIVMESILRGAMGRISGYQRVRLHSTSEVAVAGHAAEGVMHALAELLDNAANFSPLTAEVHVYVEEVPAGVVITVEDSGLVMSEVQLRRAEQAVTAEEEGFASAYGSRLGLSVVGRLARKHGLTVSFRPSARGGTGALMMLPQEVLTRAGTDVATPAAVHPPVAEVAVAVTAVAVAEPAVAEEPISEPAAPEPAAAGAVRETAPALSPARAELPPETPGAADAADSADPTDGTDSADGADTTAEHPEFGESGLPKRRRGRTLAAARRRMGETRKRKAEATTATATASSPATVPAAPATRPLRFADFRQAVRATSPQGAASTQPAGSPQEAASPRPAGPADSANSTAPEGKTR